MIVQKFIDAVTTGIIGLFGGCAYYLYMVSKGQHFRLSMFLINLFLAFFIGWISGQFLSEVTSYRDGIIAISGFCSFPILDLIEKKVPILFSEYLNKGVTK